MSISPDPSINLEISSFGENADDIRRIRQAVFVEEQGIDPKLEWDDLDATASFVLARHETAGPVATARFFADGKIGRMAVLKDWRNQGIGRAMLEEIIKHATTSGRHRLHLSAQQSAISFYEKSGFYCQGDPYYEAGILHQDMILDVIQDQ